MAHQIAATVLRNHLGDALKAILGRDKYLLITKKNKPVSALVNLDFFEDLLALASPAYRKSVREAREDYRRGRVLTHQQVFGQL